MDVDFVILDQRHRQNWIVRIPLDYQKKQKLRGIEHHHPITMPPFSKHDVYSLSQIDTGSERSESSSFIDQLVDLKNPLSPTSPRKEVTFSPVHQVKRVRHIDDYTKEETRALWYQGRELNRIKHDRIQTTKRIGKNKVKEDDCVRGLEVATSRGYQQLQINRVNSRSAVISEQFKQRQMGKCDPCLISGIYREVVLPCRVEALHIASQDAEDAKSYQEETPKPQSVALQVRHLSNPCWLLDPSKWLPQLKKTALVDPSDLDLLPSILL